MAPPPADRVLVLLRHAKSSWKTGDLPDRDRPLNDRGRRAAPVMGAWLAQAGLVPDRVLCSDARRARETWQRMRAPLGAGPRVRYLPDLYLAEPEVVSARLRRLPDSCRRALVIGHNPGLQSLAMALAATADRAAARRLAVKFPTAAAAAFHLGAAPWSSLGPDVVCRVTVTAPRDLDNRPRPES